VAILPALSRANTIRVQGGGVWPLSRTSTYTRNKLPLIAVRVLQRDFVADA